MSAREWKAGDVARVSWAGDVWNGKTRERGPHTELAIRTADDIWSLASSWSDCIRDEAVTAIEPLLVIDPEILKDAKRLTGLYNTGGQEGRNGQRMQRALRAMLEPPAPPKPEEPTEYGVIRASWDDCEPEVFFRVGGLWAPATGGDPCSYRELTNVTVIRPGITPDEPEVDEALPQRWPAPCGRSHPGACSLVRGRCLQPEVVTHA